MARGAQHQPDGNHQRQVFDDRSHVLGVGQSLSLMQPAKQKLLPTLQYWPGWHAAVAQLSRQVLAFVSQSCGLAQSPSTAQPATHIILAVSQYCPRAQELESMHPLAAPWQVFVVRSQVCGAVQLVSLSQPAWQVMSVALQYCPA
jgi:hypothetical protein